MLNTEENEYETQFAMMITETPRAVKIIDEVCANTSHENRKIISHAVSKFLKENQEKTIIKEKNPSVVTLSYAGNRIIFGFSENTPLAPFKTKNGYKSNYVILNVKRDDDGILSTEIKILGFYDNGISAFDAYMNLTDIEKKNTFIYTIVND